MGTVGTAHKNMVDLARVLLFIFLFLFLLIVLALISLSNRNNPGARSSIYVLLDAF